jgi:uncharacterized repeat protein (TIGR03803 family)
MQSKKSYPAEKAFFVICLALLLTLVITAQSAQTFKVLHTFHGKDGARPIGQLVLDREGNFYGTTGVGGLGACQLGCGTAFKMNMSGTITWTHSFRDSNGQNPGGGLLRDSAGTLYGTTAVGGIPNNDICSFGCGVVFTLDKTGKKETVLHKFTGTPDGYFPFSLLVEDLGGNLYGPTDAGGVDGLGAIFKVDEGEKESVFYSFSGGSDGCEASAGVILDSAGNLYGVTLMGGAGFCNSGYGVAFKLDAGGNETVLHTFEGSDGANPASVLLFDSQGNLYGTTENGGSSGACEGGCGTVFELSPQENGGWLETVLYNFCSLSGCADGLVPGNGPLVRDAAGNLYGTTEFGGTYRNCNGEGCGVVFKLDATGKETVLHSFTGGRDGASPVSGLTIDSDGNLYGAAVSGGDLKCKSGTNLGCGTVFKITHSGRDLTLQRNRTFHESFSATGYPLLPTS